MQKIELSNEQLNEVIRLRKSGSKWLQIQVEAGISRHVAKREYEKWEQEQSQVSLREARKDVAAQAFREHINYLIRVAEILTERLRLPTVNDVAITDDFLDELWKSHKIYRLASFGSETNPDSDDTKSPALEPKIVIDNERNLRQNRMLFQSLVAHTRDKVRQKDLDDWKNSWNSSISAIRDLREEAIKMLDRFFSMEESAITGVTIKVEKHAKQQRPFKKMVEAVLKELLQRLEKGEIDLGGEVTRIREKGNLTQLTYLNSFSTILDFDDVISAKATNRACNFVSEKLVNNQRNLVTRLKTGIDEIGKINRKFQEVLDPLVLEPMIFRTSCDLCPA